MSAGAIGFIVGIGLGGFAGYCIGFAFGTDNCIGELFEKLSYFQPHEKLTVRDIRLMLGGGTHDD